MADINEELRVLVTAEVDKAVRNLKNVDAQTKQTEVLFKKLGATIASAFSVKAIIDFSEKSLQAYRVQKQAVSVLNSVLESTGATAWTSSRQLQEMASSLQEVTNYGDETILSMQQVLLGFRNIKGDNFKEATKAILDMATVMKMDLSSAAQSIGKALDDPINGMNSLKKQGFNFTAAQKKVIESLIETGQTAEAQKIILDEMNSTFGGAAEAAADSATQIKNAWGDLQEGVGSFLSGFADKNFTQNIIKGINIVGEAFNTFHDNIAFLKSLKNEAAFNEWYATLVPEKQVDAAIFKINELEKSLSDLKNNTLGPSAREEILSSLNLTERQWKQIQEDGENALEAILEDRLRMWKDELSVLNEISETDRNLQEAENARLETESAINDLMLEISRNYEKLGKDDPSIQLKNYKKELEDIKRKREELSKTVLDSDGNIIDTTEALSQLDYIEAKLREKIREMTAPPKDGKEAWQKWLGDILDVDTSAFKTGKEAGTIFVNGLEQAVVNAEGISNALGEKFSKADFLDSQLEEIKDKITEALSIDPSKINEIFSLDELEKETTALGTLAAEYKELKKQRDEAFAKEELAELETAVANLGKSETELYLAKLEENGATAEQIEKARELRQVLDEYKEKTGDTAKEIGSLWDLVSEKTKEALENTEGFTKKSAESMASLASGLAQLSFNSAVSGLKELGKALGEGKDAGESMEQALSSMAQEILNQLPLLMMQAGLQLIAQGQWTLGLGLMAGGLVDSVISGFVQGKTGSKANALGGVYGDDGYSAFAKGGAFTNQIVSKPTYFRFAKGSGFGTGLMGEAGPEAIMPLTRGADGSLGVTASGISGGDVQVNIPVTVYSDEPVEVHDTEDENGQRKIEILVGSMINQHIAGGKADRALKSRYGLKVQGV